MKWISEVSKGMEVKSDGNKASLDYSQLVLNYG